jgi:hypothetical protein
MMPQTFTERERVKRAVRQRDGYRCTRCGMTDAQHRMRYGRGLHVHRNSPGEAYDVALCLTLCWECHGLAHGRVARAGYIVPFGLARALGVGVESFDVGEPEGMPQQQKGRPGPKPRVRRPKGE